MRCGTKFAKARRQQEMAERWARSFGAGVVGASLQRMCRSLGVFVWVLMAAQVCGSRKSCWRSSNASVDADRGRQLSVLTRISMGKVVAGVAFWGCSCAAIESEENARRAQDDCNSYARQIHADEAAEAISELDTGKDLPCGEPEKSTAKDQVLQPPGLPLQRCRFTPSWLVRP